MAGQIRLNQKLFPLLSFCLWKQTKALLFFRKTDFQEGSVRQLQQSPDITPEKERQFSETFFFFFFPEFSDFFFFKKKKHLIRLKISTSTGSSGCLCRLTFVESYNMFTISLQWFSFPSFKHHPIKIPNNQRGIASGN